MLCRLLSQAGQGLGGGGGLFAAGGGLLGGGGDALHGSENVGGLGGLFFAGGGDFGYLLSGVVDHRHDLMKRNAGLLRQLRTLLHSAHAVACIHLHPLDDAGDLLSGLAAALGQLAHLVSHHREAPALFPALAASMAAFRASRLV